MRVLGFILAAVYVCTPAFVARHEGWYYACQRGPGNQLEVWKSRTPVERGECRVVWTAPRQGWNRAQVWAPELHYLRGRWYLYYAASDGRNATHRMGVLAATTDDPQGPYEDAGQLYTGDELATGSNNRWAIDGTVFALRNQLYFLWSGWEADDDVQHLYLAKMSDPTTVASNRVRICPNDCHPWERVGERHHERGLHEGPQVLVRNGRVLLVYSCSGPVCRGRRGIRPGAGARPRTRFAPSLSSSQRSWPADTADRWSGSKRRALYAPSHDPPPGERAIVHSKPARATAGTPWRRRFQRASSMSNATAKGTAIAHVLHRMFAVPKTRCPHGV